jgi:hypothetical protein
MRKLGEISTDFQPIVPTCRGISKVKWGPRKLDAAKNIPRAKPRAGSTKRWAKPV